jgi:hypothetical protein
MDLRNEIWGQGCAQHPASGFHTLTLSPATLRYVFPQGAGLQRNCLLVVGGNAGVKTNAKLRFGPSVGVAKNPLRFCFARGPFSGHFPLTPPQGRNLVISGQRCIGTLPGSHAGTGQWFAVIEGIHFKGEENAPTETVGCTVDADQFSKTEIPAEVQSHDRLGSLARFEP